MSNPPPPPPPMDKTPWHPLAVAEVARRLASDLKAGLTQPEAAERLRRHGPNRLPSSRQRSILAIGIAQFRSLIVLLLVAAAGVAFTLGEIVEAVAISLVIVLNATIGWAKVRIESRQALRCLQRRFER